jgi:hypothetical protein
VLSPYSDISRPSGELPEYSLLAKESLSSDEGRYYPYLKEWSARFDYVLVLNSGGQPDVAHFLPEKLHLLDATEMAALFRVRR